MAVTERSDLTAEAAPQPGDPVRQDSRTDHCVTESGRILIKRGAYAAAGQASAPALCR